MMDVIYDVIGQFQEMAAQSSGLSAAVIIAIAVIGLLCCFGGYRLSRGIGAIVGFVIGAAIGIVVSTMLELTTPISIVVPLAAGLIVALLNGFLQRLAVFVVVLVTAFMTVSSLMVEYIALDDTLILLISAALSLVLAILSVVLMRPVIIVITAFMGALLFADQLFEYLIQIRWDANLELLIRLGTGVVLGLIGMIYQFVSTKKNR